MAEKGGEASDGGGVKGEIQKTRRGVSVRLSADRRHASPLRQRSAGRRSSRRPWSASLSNRSASPPRCTRGRTPDSRPSICASSPRRSPSPPVSARNPWPASRLSICASPPRRSLSQRRCATAPQRRVSSPRRVSPPRIPSCEIESSSRNRPQVPGMISRPPARVVRRLDFGGKVCDMNKEPANSENNNKSKSQCARNSMNSSVEASNSSMLSGQKRPWPTNPSVDCIWKNARTSPGRVLGTLSVDLASETILPKKCVSSKASYLVNSKGNGNESRSTKQPDRIRNTTSVGCHKTCLSHRIFVCPCELSKCVSIGGSAVSMTERRLIPGGKEESDFMTRKSCHLLDGMIKVVIESHKQSICFNGSLSLENFRQTEEGDVKLTGIEPKPYSNSGGKKDNSKVADIIENDLFSETDIPTSIEELLKLLRTGGRRDEEAMSNNISLKPELERMSKFSWMLKSVIKLEDTDLTAYTEIMDKLEAHTCWIDWQKRARMNEHLLKILNYIDTATGEPVVYPQTVKGLLRFVRNSIEHLPMHSYDLTTRASLYYLFEIDHIVSGTFKGLFEALQSAMSSAGKFCKW